MQIGGGCTDRILFWGGCLDRVGFAQIGYPIRIPFWGGCTYGVGLHRWGSFYYAVSNTLKGNPQMLCF